MEKIILTLVVGFIMGLFIMFLWPVVIPAIIPGLVKAGIVAARLSFWQSVCTGWLFTILIKSTQTNNNE